MRKFPFVFFLLVIAGSFMAPQAKADTLGTVDFANNAPPAGVSVITQYCWDIGDHIVFYSGDSMLTIIFNIKDKKYINYRLKITDRGSNKKLTTAPSGSSGIYSPLTIMVNNSPAANNVNIYWTDDQTNVYDIGDFIQVGNNVIILDNAQDSTSIYEIRKIELIGD